MHRGEKGQNLVELAVVAMLLLIMLAGAVDIGRVFNNYIVITNAAREGARQASRLPCYSGNAAQRAVVRDRIIAATLAEAVGHGVPLAASNVTITPDPASGCAGEGNPIQVAVSYRFPIIMTDLLGLGSIELMNWTNMVFYGNDQVAG